MEINLTIESSLHHFYLYSKNKMRSAMYVKFYIINKTKVQKLLKFKSSKHEVTGRLHDV